jgi:hypothetical protein
MIKELLLYVLTCKQPKKSILIPNQVVVLLDMLVKQNQSCNQYRIYTNGY